MKSQVSVPSCPRCHKLMRWHSERRVLEGGRQARIQVFHCVDCGELSTAEGNYGPAD